VTQVVDHPSLPPDVTVVDHLCDTRSVTNRHKYPACGLRSVPPDRWEAFKRNTKRAGSDRSTEVNEFMRWYNHEPGAKPPTRPPQLLPDEGTHDEQDTLS
jgi:hypothetical protein